MRTGTAPRKVIVRVSIAFESHWLQYSRLIGTRFGMGWPQKTCNPVFHFMIVGGDTGGLGERRRLHGAAVAERGRRVRQVRIALAHEGDAEWKEVHAIHRTARFAGNLMRF